MERESVGKQMARAVDEGWVVGGSFFSSILAGFLIGFGLDWWLDTRPWFIVIFTLLGAFSGFMRLWHYARVEGERQDEERRRGR